MRSRYLTKQKDLLHLKVGQVIILKHRYTNYEAKKFIISKEITKATYRKGLYLTDYFTGEESFFPFDMGICDKNKFVSLEHIHSSHSKYSKPYIYYIFKTDIYDDGRKFRTEPDQTIEFNPEDANLSDFGSVLSLLRLVKIRKRIDKYDSKKYIYSFNFLNPLNLIFIPVYYLFLILFVDHVTHDTFWHNFTFPKFYPYNIIRVRFDYNSYKENKYYNKFKTKKDII